jgi:hypothetical protein
MAAIPGSVLLGRSRQQPPVGLYQLLVEQLEILEEFTLQVS